MIKHWFMHCYFLFEQMLENHKEYCVWLEEQFACPECKGVHAYEYACKVCGL